MNSTFFIRRELFYLLFSAEVLFATTDWKGGRWKAATNIWTSLLTDWKWRRAGPLPRAPFFPAKIRRFPSTARRASICRSTLSAISFFRRTFRFFSRHSSNHDGWLFCERMRVCCQINKSQQRKKVFAFAGQAKKFDQ